MPPIIIKPISKAADQPIFLYSPFSIPISQRTSLTQNNYFIFAQKQFFNKLNKESISTIQKILFFINPML